MVEDNIETVHSPQLVDILARYLESPQELCRLTAIAVLADILDEKESQILQKGQNTFKFLMEGLGSTVEDPESHWQGWYSWELARSEVFFIHVDWKVLLSLLFLLDKNV